MMWSQNSILVQHNTTSYYCWDKCERFEHSLVKYLFNKCFVLSNLRNRGKYSKNVIIIIDIKIEKRGIKLN